MKPFFFFSLTFELAEWSTHSFTVKKFLLEADEEIIQLYYHVMVVFSNEHLVNFLIELKSSLYWKVKNILFHQQ